MALLTLNLPTGSVRFDFPAETAQELKQALDRLILTLKAIATPLAPGSKKIPQKPFEYVYTGSIFLEIFCNPNLYPSPFAAKVLLTVRDSQMRLTVETELSQMMEDMSQFLESVN